MITARLRKAAEEMLDALSGDPDYNDNEAVKELAAALVTEPGECVLHAREFTALQLADFVGDWVNCHGNTEAEHFAEAGQRQHRTLQQQIFGLFLQCVKVWAEQYDKKQALERPAFGYDARNEYTCEKSSEIVKLLGRYGLRPPCI